MLQAGEIKCSTEYSGLRYWEEPVIEDEAINQPQQQAAAAPIIGIIPPTTVKCSATTGQEAMVPLSEAENSVPFASEMW